MRRLSEFFFGGQSLYFLVLTILLSIALALSSGCGDGGKHEAPARQSVLSVERVGDQVVLSVPKSIFLETLQVGTPFLSVTPDTDGKFTVPLKEIAGILKTPPLYLSERVKIGVGYKEGERFFGPSPLSLVGDLLWDVMSGSFSFDWSCPDQFGNPLFLPKNEFFFFDPISAEVENSEGGKRYWIGISVWVFFDPAGVQRPVFLTGDMVGGWDKASDPLLLKDDRFIFYPQEGFQWKSFNIFYWSPVKGERQYADFNLLFEKGYKQYLSRTTSSSPVYGQIKKWAEGGGNVVPATNPPADSNQPAVIPNGNAHFGWEFLPSEKKFVLYFNPNDCPSLGSNIPYLLGDVVGGWNIGNGVRLNSSQKFKGWLESMPLALSGSYNFNFAWFSGDGTKTYANKTLFSVGNSFVDENSFKANFNSATGTVSSSSPATTVPATPPADPNSLTPPTPVTNSHFKYEFSNGKFILYFNPADFGDPPPVGASMKLYSGIGNDTRSWSDAGSLTLQSDGWLKSNPLSWSGLVDFNFVWVGTDGLHYGSFSKYSSGNSYVNPSRKSFQGLFDLGKGTCTPPTVTTTKPA